MKNYFPLRKRKTILAALALGLCLGAPGYAHATDASEFETPEYFTSGGLDIINASAAYSKGYTGQGVTIGVSDIPVNFASPEFDTKRNSFVAQDLFPPMEDEEGNTYNLGDDGYWNYMYHGTVTSSLAAAGINGKGMHGAAFDAEIVSSPFFYDYNVLEGGSNRSDWLEDFTRNPALKAVNCSWGDTYYPTELCEGEAISSMADYWALLDDVSRRDAAVINSAAEKDKLLVFAAGNNGYAMPLPTVHWFVGKNTATNVITVTALEASDNIEKSAEGIRGDNIMCWFSNLAAFNEDATLAAPGEVITAANADFAADGNPDRYDLTGTSVAAPFVTGAAALVQQAYPYMTARQVADVLLSTANSHVTSKRGYTVTYQFYENDVFNIFYFDGTKRTVEQQKKDVVAALSASKDCMLYSTLEGLEEAVNFYPVCAYYNVPMEALFGQGIVDAGKAVDGPGALNARRLETADISGTYTVNGEAGKQALYKVDTQGYDSAWANDIKEVRVGLLSADSTEEDLQKRYNYYKTNWLDQTHYDSGEPVVGANFVKMYIDFYNDNVRESGLDGLHVGLLKTGEGRLSLTGTNTYKGASIAARGTLSIDGSIAGDAYSIEEGAIAGRGTIYGTLYNNNIAVAGDATGSGNLTMDSMVSRGVLQTQYQNGTNTQFIVNGEADIAGSVVPLPTGAPAPMPDDKYTVVKAASITGTTKDLAGTEHELTGMLSARNEIEGGNLSVVVEAANNMDGADAVQNETFDAMTAMYRNLKRNNNPRMNQMRPLFYMDSAQAKDALSSISSNASAKNMAAVQRSNVTQHLLSARLNEAFTNLMEPAGNDIWLKFGKNWGDVRGDTDYHSSATLLGWDKAVGKNWRAGVFAGYGQTSFTDNTSGNKLKDVRFGLYAGFHKAESEGMVYLDYGWLRNKLRRGVMGMTASADYHSRILELGGEYIYDFQAGKNKAWHVRPYVNAQISRLWQNGYREDGAGVYNQVVDSKHNDYFGMGLGMEFKRYLAGGNYAIRAGVKHAFAGAEPRLRYSYMGDSANTYDMRNVQDKTHFVLSIGGEVEVAKGWSLGGDATFQRGHHDKDLSCSVTVKRMW